MVNLTKSYFKCPASDTTCPYFCENGAENDCSLIDAPQQCDEWENYHICPNCGIEMTDYSRPQDPMWVCPECHGNDSGFEIEFCEECGEPYDTMGDPRCDCYEDEDEDEDEDE